MIQKSKIQCRKVRRFSVKMKPGTDAGFTLLEVMIALAVLAVGILGVFNMHIHSIQGNETAWKFTESASFAADQLERLMRLPYESPGLANGTAAQGKYTVFWQTFDAEPVENVKRIRMDVHWKDRGEDKIHTLEYYKAVAY